MYKAFDEVVDFIAVINPRGLLAFHPSAEATDRVADLILRERLRVSQVTNSQTRSLHVGRAVNATRESTSPSTSVGMTRDRLQREHN